MTAAQWRVPVTVGAFLLLAAVVVLAAHLWLRRFELGPVERLWKRGERIGVRAPR